MTAQEELDPTPIEPEEGDPDIGAVSSPKSKSSGRNLKRQVHELHTGLWASQQLARHTWCSSTSVVDLLRADALQFKKSKTVHVNPRHQDTEANAAFEAASGRAARAKQRELRKAGDDSQLAGWAQADTDASTALLELAQGQSNAMVPQDTGIG